MRKLILIAVLILSSCGTTKTSSQQLGTLQPETSIDLISQQDEVKLESMPKWKYKFNSRIELKKYKIDAKNETKQKKYQGKTDVKINKTDKAADVKINKSNDKAQTKINKSDNDAMARMNKDVEKYKAKIKKYESRKSYWWLWLLIGFSLPYLIKFVIKIVK